MRIAIFAVLVTAAALSFTIYSYRGHSQINAFEVAPHCECAGPAGSVDVFAHPVQYTFGAYKGQCVDNCRYRAPILLQDGEVMEIANVLHNDVFWTARIPIGAVEDVDILFEGFQAKVNHVAIRFIFSKAHPLILTEQRVVKGKAPQITSVSSVMISAEAVPALGQKYTMMDGMLGNYGMIFRVFTFENFKQTAGRLGHPLKAYKTRFKVAEMNELLAAGLAKATADKHGIYQLLFNNCATKTIDLALQAKHSLRSPDLDVWDVVDPFRGIPMNREFGTLRSLLWWQLINADSFVPSN